MNIIVPIPVTAAMVGASATLPEDSTAAWVANTYEVRDECHVVSTHRVYRCAVAGPSTLSPELDPDRWVDARPTNLMAPFDIYINTQAISDTTDIVYPITARFVNAVALYGVEGGRYELTVKDRVGGTVIYSRTGRLRARSRGWCDYLFGRRRAIPKIVHTGIPIRPAAEITVSVFSSSGGRRAIGMIVLGRYRPLIGLGWGGTQRGASAEPITNSYIKSFDDGTVRIERRHKATNMRATVKLARDQADGALEMLQDVLDVPVACIATDANGFRGLNTFGLISAAPVSYDSTEDASIELTIKGLI